MANSKKYTDSRLQELVRKGLPQAEIARKLGVSTASVCQRLKRLDIVVAKDMALTSAHLVVRRELNSVDQLQRINNSVHKVLEEAEAAQLLNARQLREVVSRIEECLPEDEDARHDAKSALETLYKLALDACPKELVLKAAKEIRGQLKLQLEIFQCLYDIESVRRFQEEVLTLLDECSPDARATIIRRLAERSAIRSTLELS